MIAACLLVGALALAPARADEPPARLAAVRGDVTLRLSGGTHFDPVERGGRRLDPGDAVRILSTGAAHVTLPTGVVILLPDSSTLAFERAGQRARVSLEEGRAVVAVAEPLDPGWSFTLRVGSVLATAEEQGAFVASVDEDRRATFTVIHGHLSVVAEGRHVQAQAGDSVAVPYGEGPRDPEQGARMPAWVRGLAIGGSWSGADDILGAKFVE